MVENETKPSVLLYTRSLSGHRSSFLKFMSDILQGRRAGISDIIKNKQPAIFLMIEENFFLFIILSIFRDVLKRKTVGLLFRPLPTLEGGSVRLRAKRIILRLINIRERTIILSIVPMPLDLRIKKIASSWIYDLQLWDISPEERSTFQKLRNGETVSESAQIMYNTLKEYARGRKIIVSLGAQSEQKGFAKLADLSEILDIDQWLIVAAGAVDSSQDQEKRRIESNGNIVIDRFISDEEMLAAYAAADTVWCFYEPSYDQSSGILGRALQFGVPPIVREYSFSHKLCTREHIPHIVGQNAASCKEALIRLPDVDPALGEAVSIRFREHSLLNLRYQIFGKLVSK